MVTPCNHFHRGTLTNCTLDHLVLAMTGYNLSDKDLDNMKKLMEQQLEHNEAWDSLCSLLSNHAASYTPVKDVITKMLDMLGIDSPKEDDQLDLSLACEFVLAAICSTIC